MPRNTLLPLLAWLLLPCLVSSAGEDPVVDLFNGHDLAGWHEVNCEAGVEEGVLVLQEGDGLLRTDHRYRDFVLELEYRPRKAEAWDSGIFFRCDLPPGDRKFPKQYQVNLKQGQEGNLIGVAGATSKGLVRPGSWNRLRLVVEGTRGSLEINGQPAWNVDGLEQRDGYVALQVEVPAGGQFEFRNIKIAELDFEPLFNGESLAGWQGAGADASLCWKVEDGLLVCTGDKGPWLRSERQVEDFNLRLDYKVRPGGNSGVYVRVPEDGNHHGPGSGVEVQILDDAAERYHELKPYQYAGSVYKIAASQKRVGRPAGEWNSLEIDCRGPNYRVRHNGVVIVSATVEEYPELAERRLKGFLGLQNHSEEVWFQNIRLGGSQQPALEPPAAE